MSVPKATEMTIRNFLMKELETRGVKVNTEISYRTPIGRLMPDILLRNGAEYVVETKLGAEAKLLDAMVQLYDYSKYTPTNGGFAVLFPKELRRPWGIEIIEQIVSDPKLKYIATATFKDNRASQRFVGNLSEMADWIATHVLRAPSVEADTGFAIKVLTEAVEALTASVRALKEKELEDIFGGKTVFENILQYEEGRYPLDEMKQAATYLLANQIIFYHVLSKMDLAFEDIDEDKIGKPNDLLNYFNPVLEKDYSSIFGFDVASRLPDSSTKIIKKVIMAVKALAPEKIGHDVLGKVFHELIPFNIRKSVAAFYTNNEAAEILAQLSIDDSDAKVMDLAVGSGTLLVAAYRRKRELKKKLGTYDLSKDHKKFLEEDLTGIDIMPFAAHLAVMHLSLQALLSETEKVRVAVWDSTDLKPNMDIPAIQTELKAAYKRPTLDMFKNGSGFLKDAYVKKGAITLEGVGIGEKIPLEKADVVIMNPPFTRHERLPIEYKANLKKRLIEYEDYTHGQLGLYGHFLFLADRFVKKEGRIAFVIPATILRVKSAKGVRKLLAERYIIEHIITAWQRAAFSEGAQFREILLIAKKLGRNDETPCCISSLKKLPSSMKEAQSYAQKLKSFSKDADSGETFTDEDIIARKVSQEEMRKNIDNWYVFISTYDLELPSIMTKMLTKSRENLISCKSFLKRSNGDLSEFDYRPPFHGAFVVQPFRAIKKIDEWIINTINKSKVIIENRFTKKTLQVPLKAFVIGIRRPARTDKFDVSDLLDLVIVKKFNGIEHVMKNPSNVRKWRSYVKARLANLLISRRFDISSPGTKFLAFHSEKPIVGVDMWSVKGLSSDDAKILSLWFNSSINLLALLINRTETRGAWMKLHKYTLEEMFVLDSAKLNKSEREHLLDLFEQSKNLSYPSILEQLKERFSPRKKLDMLLLKIMGYSDVEANQFLNYLYPALANEIERLKVLMNG